MRRALLLLATLAAPLLAAAPALADCVVLLHGLKRSENSLWLMEKALDRAGYRTVNSDYPSAEAPVAELAERYVTPAVAACGDDRVHFVTHSMGGILVREWLAVHHPARMGRVVMLGPPNQGSELIDTLGRVRSMSWIVGPAGMQLGTDAGSAPNTLGPARFDVGVIAGSSSWNPLYSWVIGGVDDGKVSVASTVLPGMRDHIVVPTSHTFIMNNPLVIAETLEFLAKGKFDHELTLKQAIARFLP